MLKTVVANPLLAVRSYHSATSILSTRRQKFILDSSISYLDTSEEDKPPVIFLHGNLTYSYIWRNVIPHVSPVARCLAPDLIGMGYSGKAPNSSYRLLDHYRYLNAWINEMALPGKIHLVVHHIGALLGFHWGYLNKDRLASLTYFEALFNPLASLSDFPQEIANVVKALRSPVGEELMLKSNQLMSTSLNGGTFRKMTEEELAEYTAPYKSEESRQPLLAWTRELPIEDEGPNDVVKLAGDQYKWLATAEDLPKLFIHAEQGYFSQMALDLVKDWPNNKVVTVKGRGYAQEDSPEEIGQAVKEFIHSVSESGR